MLQSEIEGRNILIWQAIALSITDLSADSSVSKPLQQTQRRLKLKSLRTGRSRWSASQFSNSIDAGEESCDKGQINLLSEILLLKKEKRNKYEKKRNIAVVIKKEFSVMNWSHAQNTTRFVNTCGLNEGIYSGDQLVTFTLRLVFHRQTFKPVLPLGLYPNSLLCSMENEFWEI